MLTAWVFLILAIATEVAGTLMMNASGDYGELWMYGLMYVLIASSYFLLSLALRKIAVGIAIAVWEGFGTALITVISFFILDEVVSAQKLAGLGLAVAGIALLHFGEAE